MNDDAANLDHCRRVWNVAFCTIWSDAFGRISTEFEQNSNVFEPIFIVLVKSPIHLGKFLGTVFEQHQNFLHLL